MRRTDHRQALQPVSLLGSHATGLGFSNSGARDGGGPALPLMRLHVLRGSGLSGISTARGTYITRQVFVHFKFLIDRPPRESPAREAGSCAVRSRVFLAAVGIF